MAWRFKVSKYKNAAPIVPKKEDWISDLKVGAPQSCSNHIKASAAFLAFNVENRGGGSLGLVPLDYRGRFESSSPLIHGHSDLITDFDFSPFDDGMLATCSTDANVKIWHIPEGGLTDNLTNAEYCLPTFDKRIERVLFHPTTEFLLALAYFDTVKLWDIKHEKEVYNFDGHSDQVQSCSWNGDGSLLTTTAKDKTIRIIDPRLNQVAKEGESHKSAKDSRVLWLGSTDRILTTGYDGSRLREVRLRDVRNFSKPYKVQSFDSSTGIFMPLYDADTNMLFLAGKADVSIMYWEISEKEPFLTEGLKHNGTVQTKGACLVPKRGLDVMTGEVNRLLQLTPNAIIPITYQVPRKTYRDFHADIFPDTIGYTPSTTVSQWVEGTNKPMQKISLDPSKRSTPKYQIHRGPLSKRQVNDVTIESIETPVPAPRSRLSNGTETKHVPEHRLSKPMVAVKETDGNNQSSKIVESDDNTKSKGVSISELRKNYEAKEDKEAVEQAVEETPSKLASLRKAFESRSVSVDERIAERRKEEVRLEHQTIKEEEKENDFPVEGKSNLSAAERRKTFEQRVVSVEEKPTSPTPKRAAVTRSFRRVCKFRHLKGTPGHKSTHIDNIRDLNRTTPGECDGMAANSKFLVLPLCGPGGKLSVLCHKVAGRLPDGVIPCLLNAANVMDFAFDPFQDNRLAVACDDGKIHLWTIDEDGLKQPTNQPQETLVDSSDKVTILKWHPLAPNILAAASGDFNIRVWDVELQKIVYCLTGHTDQIFSMAWSPCGRFIATACRDGRLRVFDARKSTEPIREGNGPVGVRGARVVWALNGQFLVTCGFSKVSERQISVYKATDLNKPANIIGTDVSPAILIPFYDPDSSTLFATGKGDSTIFTYEIGSDFPHLFPLTNHKASSVHQGLVFLPKQLCDVRQVEFCKVLRLTHSTIEPISFTVPRVKTEMFQDDLFPPTRITWEPALSKEEWLGGVNKLPKTISLQPEDMVCLSLSKEKQSGGTSLMNKPTHIRQETPPFLKGMVPSEVRQKQHRELSPEGSLVTQHKLEESMSRQMGNVATSLEQDKMEGVDSTEWDD